MLARIRKRVLATAGSSACIILHTYTGCNSDGYHPVIPQNITITMTVDPRQFVRGSTVYVGCSTAFPGNHTDSVVVSVEGIRRSGAGGFFAANFKPDSSGSAMCTAYGGSKVQQGDSPYVVQDSGTPAPTHGVTNAQRIKPPPAR